MLHEISRFYHEAFFRPLLYTEPEWTVPHELILTDRVNFGLRKYRDGKTPVLIVPPYAGHHGNIAETLIQKYLKDTNFGIYAFDLFEAKPYSPNKNNSIEDLVAFVKQCLEHINKKTHVVGLCQGGWLSAITAALYPQWLKSLTLVNAPIDTCDPDNYIYQFAQTIPMSAYKWMVLNSGGIQSGYNQLAGFYSLPSNWKNLHYDRWINLWNSVKNNREDKIKKWHLQKQWYDIPYSIAGKWYLEAVDKLFKKNLLVKGELEINNIKIDLNNIDCPVFLLHSENDEITSKKQAFSLEKFSNKVKKWTVPDTGHIGGFTSSKAMPYWEKIIACQN